MAIHWSHPVAIIGKALLHVLLPEQGLIVIGTSPATMADSSVWGLFKEAVKDDGLHGRKDVGVSDDQAAP